MKSIAWAFALLAGCGESDPCAGDCTEFGRCDYRPGPIPRNCIASRSADCKLSTSCGSRGACEVFEGDCLPLKDSDCGQSRECQENARCFNAEFGCKNPTFFGGKPGKECHTRLDCTDTTVCLFNHCSSTVPDACDNGNCGDPTQVCVAMALDCLTCRSLTDRYCISRTSCDELGWRCFK